VNPALRARIIAILVQMLLHYWMQEIEADNDGST
jgi:hypothetical protein